MPTLCFLFKRSGADWENLADFEKAREKALKIGAQSVYIEDLRKVLYVLPECKYPLSEGVLSPESCRWSHSSADMFQVSES